VIRIFAIRSLVFYTYAPGRGCLLLTRPRSRVTGPGQGLKARQPAIAAPFLAGDEVGRWRTRMQHAKARYGSGAHAGHDGKPALRSDQGRARDISEPLSKRCSPEIHFRGRTKWKEAGGASAAVRSNRPRAALMVVGGPGFDRRSHGRKGFDFDGEARREL
jgi:hypothetical protein